MIVPPCAMIVSVCSERIRLTTVITSSAGRDSEKRREAAEVGEHDRAVERPAAEARAVGLREHLLDDGLRARSARRGRGRAGARRRPSRARGRRSRARARPGRRASRARRDPRARRRPAVSTSSTPRRSPITTSGKRRARAAGRGRRRPRRPSSSSSVSVARASAPANATAVSTAARWISSSVVAATSVAAAARSCDSRASARSWLRDDPGEPRADEHDEHGRAGDADPLRLEGEHRGRGERRRGEEREAQRRELRRRLGRGLGGLAASTGAARRRRRRGTRGSSRRRSRCPEPWSPRIVISA